MTADELARLRKLAGWSVEQRDGRVLVHKAGVGGYAACETDVNNIASAILAAFALDTVDALDALRRERDELERDKRELLSMYETRGVRANKAEDERDAAMALLADFRAMAGEHWGAHPLRARTDALFGAGEG